MWLGHAWGQIVLSEKVILSYGCGHMDGCG
jgi:hypothetical protein